jgi:hypothetical protein
MPRAKNLAPLHTLRTLHAKRAKELRKEGFPISTVRGFLKKSADIRAGLELTDRAITQSQLIDLRKRQAKRIREMRKASASKEEIAQYRRLAAKERWPYGKLKRNTGKIIRAQIQPKKMS